MNWKAATLIVVLTMPAAAQSSRNSRRPFEITDNSFLIEEAFNQEAGIFQNILLIQRADVRTWSFEFTQEWPLGGKRHQLSYTIPIEAVKTAPDNSFEIVRGTFALHYRFQLAEESRRLPAIAPRISLLIPHELDSQREFGIQTNLPVSKQFADFYLHGNAGYTVEGIGSAAGANSHVNLGASVIYRLLPMVNLMLESLFRSKEHGDANSLTISPGARAGVNLGSKQLVMGAAVPLGVLENDDPRALLLYLSYELPFRKTQ